MAVTTIQRYWRVSRTPRYSLLFALPLLVLYEVMAALLPRDITHGVRNGADVMLKSAFYALLGPWGPVAFGVVLVAVCLFVVLRDGKRHPEPLRGGVFVGMLGESVALAVTFGVVVGLVTTRLLGAMDTLALAPMQTLGVPTRLMVSLGAGLYEELLFRVILVGGLTAIAHRGFGWSTRVAAGFAVVAGALIFSAAHYIGPYGDRLQLQSFVFRAIAGLCFSGIYVLRGFGIAAWTHSLYDIFLLA